MQTYEFLFPGSCFAVPFFVEDNIFDDVILSYLSDPKNTLRKLSKRWVKEHR